MESERQTRRDRIDPRLKAAGWKVVEFKEGLPTTGLSGHAIAEYPTENGPADYALIVDGQPKHAFVYICTIQRMAINLFGRGAVWGREGDEIDDDAEKLDIPIHAFDVVIADECHRG